MDNIDETSSLLNTKKVPVQVEVAEVDSLDAYGTDTTGEAPKWNFNPLASGKPSVVAVAVFLLLIVLTSMGDGAVEMLIFNRACDSNMKNGVCDPIENQLLVSNVKLVTSVLSQITSLIGISNSGWLSDRYGRKVVMMATVICAATGSICYCIAGTWFTKLNSGMFILAGVVSTLVGGFPAFVGIVNSYVADCTTPEKRTQGMFFTTMFICIGTVIGPLTGNLLITIAEKFGKKGEHAEIYALYGAIFLSIVSGIYLMFLPESKKMENSVTDQSNTNQSNMNGLNTNQYKSHTSRVSLKRLISSSLSILSPLRLLSLPDEFIPQESKHRKKEFRFSVVMLTMAFVLSHTFSVVLVPILIQYGIFRFQWTAKSIATLSSCVGVSRLFAVSLVAPAVNEMVPKYFGLARQDNHLDAIDFMNLTVGVASEAIFSLAIVFGRSTPQILFGVCLGAYGVTLNPTINSGVIKYFPHGVIAQVFAALNLVATFANISTPVIMTSVYKYTLQHGAPTFVFMLYSVFFMALVVLISIERHIAYRNQRVLETIMDE